MFEIQQHAFGILTLGLVVVGVVAVVLFRLGIPRRPEWLPAFVFMATMLVVAVSAFGTVFYDHGAGIIQGVTLVAMTVCVSVDTKNSAQSSVI